ncbi:MAG: DUF211 domain-containing protein [Haloferacaceae archaeon]
MSTVRRIVIDVLKPHDPPLVEFSRELSGIESVESVTTTLVELDQEVQNVELALEGEAVDYGAVEAAIEELGGTVHSVDQVACGSHVIDDPRAHRRT